MWINDIFIYKDNIDFNERVVLGKDMMNVHCIVAQLLAEKYIMKVR